MSPFDVAIAGTVMGTIAMVALLYPFVRALAKRIEPRSEAQMPGDVSARLARIEAAVDSIAVEVERISENQRFLTKLQSGKVESGTTPDRSR